MKVLVLSGRFGMGHEMAANAICEQFRKLDKDTEIVKKDLLEELYPHISKLIFGGFRLMVEHCHGIYNFIYKMSGKMKVEMQPRGAAIYKKLKKILEKDIPEHTVGVEFILNTLINPEYGAIKSLEEINAVGHRMVHGGERFSESVLLNKEVLEAFTACNDLAPLHNPANLKGVNAVSAILPDIPQVGVFDTAFHQTMPDYAYMYAIPYELYEKYAVRRYGFHGTSHRYVSKRVCEYLGITPEGKKIITCHIGNGGSIAAIKDGKCMDTTMGLTPLEGLMMGTRSGDIDAGAVTFIMEKEGLNTTGVSNLLNKKSGVLGVSGVSSDMRELDAACKAGNPKAILAEKMYYYRIKKYIGAYAAALGGVDIVLFTGGVGENQSLCREEVCKGLEFMGIEIDKSVNDKIHGDEAVISTPASKVKVVVIPTDEELLIASDTMDILKK